MKKSFRNLSLLGVLLLVVGCTSETKLKEQVQRVIKENPNILISAIEEKPTEFVEAFQKAVKVAQGELAKRREEEEKKKLEAHYDNPLKPEISDADAVRGLKDAPLVLVEYSDFECPFCTRGYNVVQELRKKYGKKIQFIYKHLPLSFHQQAMPAAKYFEALRLQSPELAYKFHDEIFENQRKLKNGEKFLKAIVKKIGADESKLAKDLKNPKIMEKIQNDIKEAGKFGIQGTPGFVINGVPVKGAYPSSHFTQIIGELKKRGKVQL